MSNNTFLISDLHINHDNTWKLFKNNDGSPLRPFSSSEEMTETMIERWNNTVKEFDKVYVLGDVVINKKHLHLMEKFNGKKVLIRGNHDIFKLKDYTPYFYDVRGVHVLNDMILSHIPLHRESITTRFKTNVHGHLHGNRVTIDTPNGKIIDPVYFSVCVEQIDYTPISVDETRGKIEEQRQMYPDYLI